MASPFLASTDPSQDTDALKWRISLPARIFRKINAINREIVISNSLCPYRDVDERPESRDPPVGMALGI